MYVRKFEADTIEEALRDIKRELGPEAVILKTITNKGLKGAFKKKKIEITAAISEKGYTKKAQVDTILNDNQKEEFYGGSASYIANMIDQHDQSQEKRSVQTNNQNQSPLLKLAESSILRREIDFALLSKSWNSSWFIPSSEHISSSVAGRPKLASSLE